MCIHINGGCIIFKGTAHVSCIGKHCALPDTHMCHPDAGAEADVSTRLHSMQLGQYSPCVWGQCGQHLTVTAQRHYKISSYCNLYSHCFNRNLNTVPLTLPW